MINVNILVEKKSSITGSSNQAPAQAFNVLFGLLLKRLETLISKICDEISIIFRKYQISGLIEDQVTQSLTNLFNNVIKADSVVASDSKKRSSGTPQSTDKSTKIAIFDNTCYLMTFFVVCD